MLFSILENVIGLSVAPTVVDEARGTSAGVPTNLKGKHAMTVTRVASLFRATGLGHRIALVIAHCCFRPQTGEGQGRRMAKIGLPKQDGDRGIGRRMFVHETHGIKPPIVIRHDPQHDPRPLIAIFCGRVCVGT